MSSDITELIESQERRIKELEAELASIAEGVKISVPTQTIEQEFQNHYRRGYEAGKAALRQRIADAPVVMWQSWISGAPANTFHNKQEAELHFDRMNREYPDDSRVLYQLISKEDLQR